MSGYKTAFYLDTPNKKTREKVCSLKTNNVKRTFMQKPDIIYSILKDKGVRWKRESLGKEREFLRSLCVIVSAFEIRGLISVTVDFNLLHQWFWRYQERH